MPIITCASTIEHWDFLSGNAGSFANYTSNTSKYDPTLSRCSMNILNTAEWLRPFNQTVSEVWIHFVAYYDNDTYDTFNHVMLYDTTTSSQVAGLKRRAGFNNQIHFRLWINGIGDLSNTDFSLAEQTLYEFDIHYLPDATNGKLVVYVDKQKKVEYLGNTLPTSGSTTGSSDALYLGYDSSEGAHISQVIVADESTLGKKLATIYPESDGTYNEFTSGGALDIDELTLDTSDFISTDQVNKRYTANYTNIDNAYVGYDVDAVQVTTHARLPASSAINDLQHMVRNGGSDYTTANLNITKDGSVQRLESLFQTNPVTGNNWTKADVDASEFGVKTV